MPNLVGTGLNQVPTNGMLGGLAYQDPEHASIKNLDLKNLSQINSEIADTAADVFVYDTRKDSDGGAWRKRTQDTSWYNETLNTTTRGSRKEFPAVAVIVAESTQITIYDGDDPDLPMWMVFYPPASSVQGQNHMLNRFMGDIKAISMLNGNLFVCAHSTSSANRGGALWVNFISEISYAFGVDDPQSENIFGFLVHNIAQRNTILGTDIYADKIQKYQLVDNSQCNDVAMTVLPNAPIDDTTGLPIPTIAVATDSGVSVIKDNGNVVQKALTDAATDIAKVEFTNDGFLIVNRNDYHYFVVTTIDGTESTSHPSGFVNNINYFRSEGTNFPGPLSADGQISGYGNQGIVKSIKGTDIAMADPYGLNIFNVTRGIPSTSNMVSYASTAYNTGWLHGDIKGAFLSDTDDANVTGAELITNGSFGSDTSGWTAATGTTLTRDTGAGGGRLKVIGDSSSNYGAAYQTFTTVIGKVYTLSLWWWKNSTNGKVVIRNDNLTSFGGAGLVRVDEISTSNISYSFTFTATATTTYIFLWTLSLSDFSFYDDVSIRLADPDRLINNNGLQVFGTVTKSAVATGADLVGYSGFSNSNYLKQPYTSAMDFGTGDMSVSFWMKVDGAIQESQYLYDRQGSNGNRHAIYLATANGGSLYHYFYSGGGIENYATNLDLHKDTWTHYTSNRSSSGLMEIYINGNLRASTNLTPKNLTNSNAELFIAIRHNIASVGHQLNLSNMRFSASVPSPEQIKKMYEDEKHLFQENAKATLYGSSDAVTALAYDDTTNLLHVGTSAGRSDFQGLRRINNTTDAVTTAISASNGLVAEQ